MKNMVFGPIASRRLGRSLGIDLLLRKICCQDCIYCEAGRTEILTAERREYIPAEQVIRCLKEVLDKKPELDYITFSGSGEPTLSTALGKVVDFLKDNYPQYRVCLLTNGMLLGDADVLRDIARIDLVIPSLDGSNEEEFQKINRPDKSIPFERFIRGLINFSRQFKGRIWLELFIVPGMNDSRGSVKRFAEIVQNMQIEKVQLNALDRPGTENSVAVSNEETNLRFIEALEPFAAVESAGTLRSRRTPDRTADSRLLQLLENEHLDAKEIGKHLDLSEFETGLLLKKLEFADRIFAYEKNGTLLWRTRKNAEKNL